MPPLPRIAFFLPVLALAACDEMAVANDPEALADLRGSKSCIAAVEKQSEETGAVVDTTVPIIELNRFVIRTPSGTPWTCITDDNGRAQELVENRTG